MEPRDFALAVARKAARNIGGSVSDLVKRSKSQAYLFGKLKRAFPDHSEGELRDVVHSLRRANLDEPDTAGPNPPAAAQRGPGAGGRLSWGTRSASAPSSSRSRGHGRRAMADFPSLREQLDDLDRRFGKGRTYSADARRADGG